MYDIDEVMEVDEFQDLVRKLDLDEKFQISIHFSVDSQNSVQTIDMEKIMTIGPEHLIVPPTPKRKGKTTKAKVARKS